MVMSTTAVSAVTSGEEVRMAPLPYPHGLAVLIVDDDIDVRTTISRCLRKFEVPVIEAETLGQARDMFDAGDRFSLVFLDRCLPDGDGVEFLAELLQREPTLAVCIITGQGSGQNAERALTDGAFDYLPKPALISEIRNVLLKKYPDLSESAIDGMAVGPVIDASGDEEEIGVQLIAQSGVMIRVTKEIREIARMNCSVFLQGGSGTGKEVVANKIHEMSSRGSKKCFAINCGAIPADLVEADLFGYVKGSFTGAVTDKKGAFEEADGGTIFLDEITETTLAFQVKLLRFLQEHKIRRVGSNTEIKLDVRVIASSNRNVADEVLNGRFREDLFYRLKGAEIFLPPLKDRREDIMPLAEYFARAHAKTRTIQFSKGVVLALKAYDWPGNVRELRQAVDFAVQHSNGRVLLSDLPRELRIITGDLREDEVAVVGTADQFVPLKEYTDEYKQRVLASCDGNKTRAAKILGVDRTWFGKECRERGWGLDSPES
jgi:DNA-binding NtrC family response regulator